MSEAIRWWMLVEVAGLFALPLAFLVLRNLPDRGWPFAKAIGLFVPGYVLWLLLMLIPLSYNLATILIVMLLVTTGNFVLGWRQRQDISIFARQYWRYLLATEALFTVAYGLLCLLRAYMPAINGQEKFMDEAFITAIIRSTHLPPNDPWLAGFPINYYYFGHFLVATWTKVSGLSPGITFNLAVATLFGLTAVHIYSVVSNLVAAAGRRVAARVPTDLGSGVAAEGGVEALSVLATGEAPVWETARVLGEGKAAGDLQIAGRVEVFPISPVLEENEGKRGEEPSRQWSHLITPPVYVAWRLGAAWPYALAAVGFALLVGNLAGTGQFFQHPDQWANYNWWDPSRAVTGTITEFPAFTFLLADLHAHVLALPFTVLAVAIAFNFYLGEGIGALVFGDRLTGVITVLLSAALAGGLYIMNGWDLPPYLALICGALALQQYRAQDSYADSQYFLSLCLTVALFVGLGILLFLPFYLTFISPAQGVGIVTVHTAPGQFFSMFGLFAFLLLTFLWLVSQPLLARSQLGRDPSMWLALIGLFFLLVVVAGLAFNGALFIGLGFLALGILWLLREVVANRALTFVLLLAGLAVSLLAGCEIFYLRDVFGGDLFRMNTVFKLYFQAWVLLSIVSGFALFYWHSGHQIRLTGQVESLPPKHSGQALFWAGLLVLTLASAVYPVLAIYSKTGHFADRSGLDGLKYLSYDSPADYETIVWLNQHVKGPQVILEATGGEYSDFARLSVFTGMPTILGWAGHESQWRVRMLNDQRYAGILSQRKSDIDTLYTSSDPALIKRLLKTYHIAYVYVGRLERATYPAVDMDRFNQVLHPVYQPPAGEATLYQVLP